MMSIKRQTNLGQLSIISGVNQKAVRPQCVWPNPWCLLEERLAREGLISGLITGLLSGVIKNQATRVGLP